MYRGTCASEDVGLVFRRLGSAFEPSLKQIFKTAKQLNVKLTDNPVQIKDKKIDILSTRA